MNCFFMCFSVIIKVCTGIQCSRLATILNREILLCMDLGIFLCRLAHLHICFLLNLMIILQINMQDSPLIIECFNFNSNGKHDLIG